MNDESNANVQTVENKSIASKREIMRAKESIASFAGHKLLVCWHESFDRAQLKYLFTCEISIKSSTKQIREVSRDLPSVEQKFCNSKSIEINVLCK